MHRAMHRPWHRYTRYDDKMWFWQPAQNGLHQAKNESVILVLGEYKLWVVGLIQASTKVRVMRGYGGESKAILWKNIQHTSVRNCHTHDTSAGRNCSPKMATVFVWYHTMFLSCSVRQNWLFPKMTTLVRFCPTSFVQSVLSNQFVLPNLTPQNLVGVGSRGPCHNFSERTTHYW